MEEPVGIKLDKRKVSRKYLVFYLRVFDGMSSKVLGHLVDISDRGFMIVCDEPIAVNEDYRLRMRLPTTMKDRQEVVLSATSRWCKLDSNPDFYLAGFQMHDLEQQTKNLIAALIRDFGY
jgi:hypothetical protein